MKVKLILKRAILIIAVLAVIGWFIWQITAAKTILTTPNFWTFDIASGIAIIVASVAVYFQTQELKANKKAIKDQTEQAKELTELTKETAKATRLQTEIEFCKKIECQMVYMFNSSYENNNSRPEMHQIYEIRLAMFLGAIKDINPSNDQKIKYRSLYEKLKDYLKPDSQLYNHYLGEDSDFTAFYKKCKEVTKSQ